MSRLTADKLRYAFVPRLADNGRACVPRSVRWENPPFIGIEPPQGARLVREGSVELFALDMKAGETVAFKRANA